MSMCPSIINWFGGKQKLARQIISIMPEHQHYVEVFMGGAAVFFNKPKVPRNTLNDINGNLVNLFIQVRDNYDILAEKIYWTLHSRKEYIEFYKHYSNGFKDCDDITRAMMYLLLIRGSFNGMIEGSFSASIESSSAKFNLALLERIKLARIKLDSVVIENRHFKDIIKKYDAPGSLLYLDPPYYITLKEKSYYEYRLSEFEHTELANYLHKCKAPWILSYDDVPEIITLYKNNYLQRLSVKYVFGSRKRSRKVNELLIANFPMRKPQLNIFDEDSDISIDDITDEEINSSIEHIKLKREKEYEEQMKKLREEPKENKQNVEQISFL